MKKNKNQYTVVELFAGAGGLALGLEKAGFSSKGLFEIDKWAVQTLKKNRPSWNVMQEDIIKVTEEGIDKYLQLEEELDLLSGGYPCQSFSYAGKGLGLEDTRGTLFYNYGEFLKKLKPKIFLAENVKGLLSHNKGETLKIMIDVFENLGYKVKYKVLNSLDYNVSQKRQRLIIIGVRNDIYNKIGVEFQFPEPNEKKILLKDILKKVPESPYTPYSEKKKAIFKLVPQGGCWRNLPEDIAKEYMGNSFYLGGGKTGMARKMSWNEPGLTVLCTPSQKQTDRCHPDELRPFTVRENARIQSFPDDWEFLGSISAQYKQIGNAVPVNLSVAIGKAIIDYLKLEEKNDMCRNYNLSFISNENLFNHVKETIGKYVYKINLIKFNKNIIDPIKLTFDSKIYGKTIEEIINSECIRQMDKSNSTYIGYFQQNILAYLYNKDTKQTNWTVLKKGFDVINEVDKIYVEVKNKHNTMNSSSAPSTYMKMQNKILKDSESICMLVEIITKKSSNEEWKISLDGEKMSNKRIRRVSIDKFYEIVTGEKEAFKQLVEILPKVMEDVLKDMKIRGMENTVFEELKKIDENILKSLYLLAFAKYEGFETLHI